ncbi:hypothetical protein TTHERM_00105070 (macronuclear) [Tetrahymena thermophila SB210]|uniref:Uncharacterized protein n=1 Tax=Tetrahymena thermophila (strain SB210) TaxID=312017 RepID=Q234I9_TETTS|nr:hypothetical protein TTHERM_00105070 [Tetrahymena thermophila SB210]EAR92014.2 hypothetical protein TTHERM_00105070 [Tetrahymena thermophila SB210]|eukprot:XP_001012259.2 hypothetical protein TTHERM_00105070 [Tetrahymena thermophila SB210]
MNTNNLQDHIKPNQTHYFNDEQYAYFLKTLQDRFQVVEICCPSQTNCQICNKFSNHYSNLSNQADEFKYSDSKSIQVFVKSENQSIIKLFYRINSFQFQNQEHFDKLQVTFEQNLQKSSQYEEEKQSFNSQCLPHSSLEEDQIKENNTQFNKSEFENGQSNYNNTLFNSSYLSETYQYDEQTLQLQNLQKGPLEAMRASQLLLINQLYNQQNFQTEEQNEQQMENQQLDNEFDQQYMENLTFEIGFRSE